MNPQGNTTIVELNDKILSLIANYPEACARTVRRLTRERADLERLAITFAAIGYDYSRHLYPWITDLTWFMMESLAADAFRRRPGVDSGRVLLSVYTDLLSECMDTEAGPSDGDPFAFLRDLSEARLVGVLSEETASELALISVFWNAADMARIFAVVPESIKLQTVAQIARLRRIPAAEARKAALRLAERLAVRRGRPPEPVAPVTPSVRAAPPRAAALPTPAPRAARPPVSPTSTDEAPKPSPIAGLPPLPPPPPVSAQAAADPGSAEALERSLLLHLRDESPDIYRELAETGYFGNSRSS